MCGAIAAPACMCRPGTTAGLLPVQLSSHDHLLWRAVPRTNTQPLPAASCSVGGDLLPSLHYNLPPSVLHVTLSVLYLTREACSGARQQQSRSKLIVKTARMLWPAPDPPIHIPESLHAHKHPHNRETSLCHLSFIKLLGKNRIPKNKISLACNYIYSNNLERQTKNTAWHFIQTLRSLSISCKSLSQ